MSPDLTLFLDRLRMRLAQLDPLDVTVLAEKSPVFRTDMLFELGADLSDVLARHESGLVGEDVVREAAVAVALEALKVWLSTVRKETGDGTH